jgi:TatA/E family protein of Tat protein translocase
MPFNIGAPELIVILIIALVVLGPGKLPDVAASLGKSIREFRRAASDVSDAARIDAPAQPATQPQAPTAATAATAATTPPPPSTTSPPTAPAEPAEPPEPASDPDRS